VLSLFEAGTNGRFDAPLFEFYEQRAAAGEGSRLAAGGRADNGRIGSAGGDRKDEENTFRVGAKEDISSQ
jgi:hypothetical protein